MSLALVSREEVVPLNWKSLYNVGSLDVHLLAFLSRDPHLSGIWRALEKLD